MHGTNKFALRCLNCATPMQLLRRTARFGGLPDLYSFYCCVCDEWHVEEGDAVARSALAVFAQSKHSSAFLDEGKFPKSDDSTSARGIASRNAAHWEPRFRGALSADRLAASTFFFETPAISASHNSIGGQRT